MGAHRVPRRTLSISLVLLVAAIMLVTLPASLLLAAIHDRLRDRSALPCLVFVFGFLIMELCGVVALFAVWLARPWLSEPAWLQANFRIQVWWTTSLLALARMLFRLRIEVEGAEQARDTPHVLLPRHVSFGDTIFACSQVSAPFGVRHRYILKAPLRWDPSIDIAGHRLGCCFVERGSGKGAEQMAIIRAACEGLGPGEGVLIYPEGTRHTPVKRRQRIEQLRRHEPAALEVAESLRHVLYPHASGSYAAFAGAGFPDAVFLAHAGFEGSASFASLMHGGLRNAVVRLRFWRVPGASIPREFEAFSVWLVEQWQRMDEEIEAMRDGGRAATPPSP